MKLNMLLIVCLTASVSSAAEPKVNGPARTRIPDAIRNNLTSKLNITYARYGDRTLELDLYRPKDAVKPLPGILCIHGGGWANGNRAGHANLAMALASRGFVAATISYRLSGEAPFPAAIHDCKAAVRWMRANAGEYGIKPDAIGAIGLSAGGHLVALLATSAGVEELEGAGGNASFSSAIQAAVPMGAQTDLQSERTRIVSASDQKGAIWQQFLGGTQAEQPATYRLASPLVHLDADDPPLAFISGEDDDASTHADLFRTAMTRLQISTQLRLIPGAPHPFLGRQEWFDDAVSTATEFFDIHLKGQKK
ncbi:MAG: alpha/beta hydrolase [Rhodopirellula sp.]|nr:alpha/beta hydrolase [Rhodopirellula sp.]